MVKMYAVIIFIILKILVYTTNVKAKRNYDLNLNSVNYTVHHPGLMRVEQFYCGKNDIGISTFTLHLRMQQNITDFQLYSSFQILRKGSKSVIDISPMKINVCELLKGNYYNNLIKLGTIELLQVTKPTFLCPLIKNTLYTINNYTLRLSIFPTYLPLLNFVQKSELFMEGKHYLDIIFKGKVIKAK